MIHTKTHMIILTADSCKENNHQHIKKSCILLGWSVGTCCAIRSSLSICRSVVLPALSKPRNTNLPDFLYKPASMLVSSKLIDKLSKRVDHRLGHQSRQTYSFWRNSRHLLECLDFKKY